MAINVRLCYMLFMYVYKSNGLLSLILLVKSAGDFSLQA